MRKRSKKRIPQDILPWIRVNNRDEGTLNLFHKKTTRWITGNRRDWNTALLNTQANRFFSQLILKSWLNNHFHMKVIEKSLNNQMPRDKESIYRNKLNKNLFSLNKKSALSKPKNFCLFSGKGRSHNRKLFISRQIFRKLIRLNAIVGLQNNVN